MRRDRTAVALLVGVLVASGAGVPVPPVTGGSAAVDGPAAAGGPTAGEKPAAGEEPSSGVASQSNDTVTASPTDDNDTATPAGDAATPVATPTDDNATATPADDNVTATPTDNDTATPADDNATADGGVVARGGDRPQFDPGIGGPATVVVDASRPVVFRGESGVAFETSDGERLDPAALVGAEADAEGVPLQMPIPTDQPEGTYATDPGSEAGVVVQSPRVSDLELLNSRGADVAGGAVEQDQVLLVRAEWNFGAAEDLSLLVTDEQGNDVTGGVLAAAEVLSGAQRAALSGPYADHPERLGTTGERGTGTGVEYLAGAGQFDPDELDGVPETAFWVLDTADLPAGNYTVRVEGWQDLTAGAANRTVAIEVEADQDVTLDLSTDAETRGRTVPFTVRGGMAGAVHYVTIEADAFVEEQPDQRALPQVEDVTDNGVVDTDGDGTPDVAYARLLVDPDSGSAGGRIDTIYLAEGDVEVTLHDDAVNHSDLAAGDLDEVDDATLTVQEPNLTIAAPADTYVAGEAVTVRGTATTGIESVAVYARSDDDTWSLLDVSGDGERTRDDAISVGADGTWEAEDVVLSEAATVLSFPGRQRFAVVEVVDVAGPDDDLPARLADDALRGTTKAEAVLVVEEPRFGQGSRVLRAVGGEVALVDGTVDVRGSAPGEEAVLVVVVDERGQLLTERVDVDDDGGFSHDNLDLSSVDGEDLAEGELRAFVVGTGRDGVVGDGTLPGQDDADLAALEAYLAGLGVDPTTEQVVEILRSETTGATGSDDLLLEESFRYVEARTTVEGVGPAGVNVTDGVRPVAAGETLVVAGTTNRQPEDATIVVVVRQVGEDLQAGPVTVSRWGIDGRWSVEVDTGNLTPGTYRVVADDGVSTDRERVEITDGTGNATGDVTTPASDETTPASDETTPASDETTPGEGDGAATGNETATPDETGATNATDDESVTANGTPTDPRVGDHERD